MKRTTFLITFLFVCLIYITPTNTLQLSKQQKRAIGMQIWQNETGKKHDLLVFWNENEPFPSLGICHNVWLPAHEASKNTFTQTFPELIDFFKQKQVALPEWLKKTYRKGAPWHNKKEFDNPRYQAQKEELKQLLSNTIDLQIDFVLARVQQAWKKIDKKIDPKKRIFIDKHYKKLLSSPQGIYVLVDYINFKGEGTNTKEHYNHQGWGLLQVLEAMPHTIPEGQECKAFAQAARKVLTERVRHAPADKQHEKNWLPGWFNRIDTYTQSIFS